MLRSAFVTATRFVGAVVVSTALATSAAVALPQFTWSPSAVGGIGSDIVANNILISNYTTVTLTPNGGGGADFFDTGVLPITGFQLGDTPVTGTGLNTTFGLYFGFTGTGTQNTPGFNSSTVGTFDTLDFTLYGYNVTGPVEYQPTNITPTGVVDPIALATGSLISGGVGATTLPGVAVVPNANTLLTFSPTVLGQAFFQDPDPFYSAVFAAFTNNPSQVTFTDDGFVISNGGGSANFLETPVPEPASLALLGAGLAGLGLIRRRGAAA